MIYQYFHPTPNAAGLDRLEFVKGERPYHRAYHKVYEEDLKQFPPTTDRSKVAWEVWRKHSSPDRPRRAEIRDIRAGDVLRFPEVNEVWMLGQNGWERLPETRYPPEMLDTGDRV